MGREAPASRFLHVQENRLLTAAQSGVKEFMSRIHDHEINPANASITIEADAPTQGNSSHVYTVTASDGCQLGVLRFQNGPVNATAADGNSNGVNGLTHEVLLAIILDRLRGFQSGHYACRENALAITKLEEALQWMHWRTRGRQARGVEGTHEV